MSTAPITNSNRRSSLTTIIIAGLISVAALRFARDLLIPMALAVMFSFLLAPAVERLKRFGVGRTVSVVAVTAMAFTLLGVVGYLITDQATELAAKMGEYRANLSEKLVSTRTTLSSLIQKATATVEEIEQEMAVAPAESPDGESADSVATVRIEGPPRNILALVQQAILPLTAPLATAGIVIVLVVFILLYRDDLRDRLIRLVGLGQIQLTTTAFDDAAERVSRYLLAHTCVNALHGSAVGVGLLLLGIPNALLFGLLTAILRFIPYLGPWVAAAMPILLSLAVSKGWSLPLLIIAYFIVIELVSNNLLEPWMYGHSTGLSPLAIIVSAIFWTWLWGIVGLLLATPLTVCLLVTGKYVPRLGFLNILLSDQPAFDVKERIYQRMLAMDEDESWRVVEDFLKTHDRAEVYDGLLVPALSLVEVQRHLGELDDSRSKFAYQFLRDALVELEESKPMRHISQESESPAYESRPGLVHNPSIKILCLPAADEADELCAMMLQQQLAYADIPAEVVSLALLASEMVNQVHERNAGIVCVSALPPVATTPSRYLYKRLRAAFPTLKILIGLWNTESALERSAERIGCKLDEITNTLTGATETIKRWLAVPIQNSGPPEISRPPTHAA